MDDATTTPTEASRTEAPQADNQPPADAGSTTEETQPVDADANAETSDHNDYRSDLARAIKRRDRALERARDAETERDSLRAEVEALKTRITELEPLADRAVEYDRHLETEAEAKRTDAFIAELSKVSGVTNTTRLRALCKEAGIPVDPENPTPKQVKDTITRLKTIDPDTFAPAQTKPAPVPGQGIAHGPGKQVASRRSRLIAT